MFFGIFLPLAIGAMGVLQNTLNKQLAPAIGLPMALLVNGLVLFACTLAFFFGQRFVPAGSLPEIFRTAASPRAFRLLDALPGLFGFLIIASAPWAIERSGATKVFIGIIAAQLVVTMLWDWWVFSVAASGMRLLGGALALAGALLAAI